MRVQEILGKDVHNMKARSLPHKTRSKLGGVRRVQDLRGGAGGFRGSGPGGSGRIKTRKNQKNAPELYG